MPPHLFIGPTAENIPAEMLAPFSHHPPVAAGTVATLLATEKQPGTIVLVDGNLESGCEIPDEELLEALQAGWQIHGLASVGALKAAALRRHGMQGFGLIARYACLFPERAKDEVAALYFPTPPYAAASEPLIELRLLLRALRRRGAIDRDEESSLAARLTSAPLEDRTFESVANYHPAAHKIPATTWRAKRRDLLAFLHTHR